MINIQSKASVKKAYERKVNIALSDIWNVIAKVLVSVDYENFYPSPPTKELNEMIDVIKSVWEYEDTKPLSIPKFNYETALVANKYRIKKLVGQYKHVAALILFLFYSNCDVGISGQFLKVLEKFKHFSAKQTVTDFEENLVPILVPQNPTDKNLYQNDLGK